MVPRFEGDSINPLAWWQTHFHRRQTVEVKRKFRAPSSISKRLFRMATSEIVRNRLPGIWLTLVNYWIETRNQGSHQSASNRCE